MIVMEWKFMNKFIMKIFKKRYLIMGCLLAALVVILSVVVLVFYTGNNSDDIVDNPDYDNSESLTSSQSGLLNGDSTFLLVGNGKKPGEIIFMTLVEFRIYSESIIVTPLSYDTDVSGSTYGEYYAYGGISMLKNAVENTRQCKIDRYVVVDEDGFCDIVDMMGKVPVTVNEEFTYISSDKSYVVSVGDNEFESPLLYSYIKVIAAKNNPELLADLLCTVINEYMPSVDSADAQEYFEVLCNYVNTDLSIADYYSCSADIAHLIDSETVCIPYYKGEQ